MSLVGLTCCHQTKMLTDFERGWQNWPALFSRHGCWGAQSIAQPLARVQRERFPLKHKGE
eukprot:2220055-Amphidinium_carterae.1